MLSGARTVPAHRPGKLAPHPGDGGEDLRAGPALRRGRARELGSEDVISGPADPEDLPDAGQEMLTRFEDEYGREPGPWAAYGYEAMASVLAAIDRAGDPLSRSSVVDAYFDGTERDSVLGTYSITAEGETTLDAPLAAYHVEAGALVPER
jgi:ABC-type branched-subunit amino acid transport system substrate-binding protein